MASGQSVQTKVAKVLARLQPTSRTVSFREIAQTGGNRVLGLGTTVTSTDVVVDPQPSVEILRTDEIADSSGFLQMGDYKILFAGTVAESTFKTNMIIYGDEVLKVVQYIPIALDKTVVAWEVMARAV
jgi:hypothetical protein